MSLNVWNTQSGLLATIQEGINTNIQLPALYGRATSFAVISGALPPGLWLDKNYIKGTAYEVPRETTFTCCIRATVDTEISDRTFSIIVIGADAPVILTPAGLLDIGPKQQLYVIDDTFVNYQIRATDSDVITGQTLTYFIDPDYGILPPGLSLTKDGVIYGIVQSVTSLTPADGTGAFDTGLYDIAPYDFAYVKKHNGYDIYDYDKAPYDYYTTSQPKTLNRHYKFRVFVTDGQSTTPLSQLFEIFVVNDNFFRADSDAILSDMALFTADISYLSQPIWITQSFLGTYRADNYVTLMLDVYDTGLIYYTLKQTTTSWVPNHSYAINDLVYHAPSKLTYICMIAHISGSSLNPSNWVKYGLPPGMMFDDKTGEVYGTVPKQPAVTTTYTFTVVASRHGDEDTAEIAETLKTFTVNIIGEIESSITWTTVSDLGHIDAGYDSLLYVRALSLYGSEVTHTLLDGALPSGLTLMTDGEIIGKATQFSTAIAFDQNKTTFIDTTFNQSNIQLGLTTFSSEYFTNSRTSFDHDITTFDRKFTFTVKASDQSYYSAVNRTFTITVNTPNRIQYSNIRVKPFLTPNRIALWNTFINSSVFTFENLYRPYDPVFGLQTELAMLIFEGIKTTKLSDYIPKIPYATKQFRFGSIKKASAILPGTTTAIYEVVYITVIDQAVTNTVNIWRSEFSNINLPKYNFLPLWMRSVQANDRKELGFTLAVPLCYCKVGTADDIILNIKYSNFDFKMIDYQIDRFIINAIEGSNSDKYIIFNNKETK